MYPSPETAQVALGLLGVIDSDKLFAAGMGWGAEA